MEVSKKRKRLPPPERVRSKKIGLLIGFGANYRPSSDFIHQAESGSHQAQRNRIDLTADDAESADGKSFSYEMRGGSTESRPTNAFSRKFTDRPTLGGAG